MLQFVSIAPCPVAGPFLSSMKVPSARLLFCVLFSLTNQSGAWWGCISWTSFGNTPSLSLKAPRALVISDLHGQGKGNLGSSIGLVSFTSKRKPLGKIKIAHNKYPEKSNKCLAYFSTTLYVLPQSLILLKFKSPVVSCCMSVLWIFRKG